MVTVAVDTRQRIEQALDEVSALASRGLVTLERARLLTGQLDQVRLPEGLAEATKLTVYLGRHQRATSGRPAFLEVVDCCTAMGSTARPCCWGWTAPPTGSAGGPDSSAATPRCR
jgi:PII-like signaling protein